MKLLSALCKSIAGVAAVMSAAIPGNAASALTSVTLAPDTVSVFRNPLTGWVMYLGRTWDSDFWEKRGYDSMLTSTGDTVRVSDYASCAYIRTSWASFEPEEGKYAWNDPDSRLMRLMRSVWDRGMRIAFRVVIDGRDQGQNTPQYVFDAGAEGYYDPKNPGKNYSPYPDDPVFQEKYAKFFHAMAEEFDDPEKVEFIDAYSLGKWGESHSMIYKDNANKEAVFDWVTSLATSCFKRVPMLIHYHRMLGDPADDGWGAVPENAERMISKAVDLGFSLRHDAFGMNGYYQDWEKAQARKWNFNRPIIMEGGWITGAHHRYWIDPSGEYRQGHAADVRLGEYKASREARVNMMDFRINDETRSWFEEAFPLVKGFIAEGGYRLYPDSLSLPSEFSAGETVAITHRWNNLGWGYCPTNIPQWNQCYKVGFALLEPTTLKPVKVWADNDTRLDSWLKGKPVTYTSRFVLDGVNPGNYVWGVALVDVRKDCQVGIRIAAKDNVTPLGWVALSNVIVK